MIVCDRCKSNDTVTQNHIFVSRGPFDLCANCLKKLQKAFKIIMEELDFTIIRPVKDGDFKK